jgi:threonine/homoserine/homoserine lactone efflux protein
VSLGLFVVAALLLLITPGPAVLYIVTRSMDQGRRAGLISVAGVHAGTFVHVGAAAAGLSALLATSAVAFTASCPSSSTRRTARSGRRSSASACSSSRWD